MKGVWIRSKGKIKPKIIFGLVFVLAISVLFFTNSNSTTNNTNEPKQVAYYSAASLTLSATPVVLNSIFSENNTLTSSSFPFFVSSQVYATMLEEEPEKEMEKDIILYTVKDGDTLAGVAGKFNLKLNTLLWANDLTSKSVIKPGDKLVILPVDGVMHIVEEGDTPKGLSEYYQAKVEDIIEFNEIEDGKIFIGDILVIPGGKMPAPKQTTIASPPSGSQLTLPNSYFMVPASGKITQALHFYNAVDIANKCGTTPIYASAGGTVQVVDSKWPYGNYIRILHPNGVVTLYAHLSKISVSLNQQVNQGQIVGYMGATGNATGCHLHFEIRGATNPFANYPRGTSLSIQK